MQILDGNEIRSAQKLLEEMNEFMTTRPESSQLEETQSLYDEYAKLTKELRDMLYFNVVYRMDPKQWNALTTRLVERVFG
jgi:phosphoribosyl-ATP pyrophosphohydrolase